MMSTISPNVDFVGHFAGMLAGFLMAIILADMQEDNDLGICIQLLYLKYIICRVYYSLLDSPHRLLQGFGDEKQNTFVKSCFFLDVFVVLYKI